MIDLMQIFTLLTGVIYIVLEIRQKNFMWVVGIATSLAAMWVFFRQGLYASFGLNTYYFITAFIGLWQWRRNRAEFSADSGSSQSEEKDDVIILNRLTLKTVLVSALVSLCGIMALSYGMSALHKAGILGENPMSVLDSMVTVLSAVATWWLVKSYREQWWLWIVADTLSVVLCATQGMWAMSVLYLAYVAAAVYGLHYWKIKGVYINGI